MTENRKTMYVKFSDFDVIKREQVSFPVDELKKVIELKYFLVRHHLNLAVPQFLRLIGDEKVSHWLDSLGQNQERRIVVAFWDLPGVEGIRVLRTQDMGRLVSIS